MTNIGSIMANFPFFKPSKLNKAANNIQDEAIKSTKISFFDKIAKSL